MKKKSSENDQLTGHFQSVCFFVPDPKSEKELPINQQIKKLWPNWYLRDVSIGMETETFW